MSRPGEHQPVRAPLRLGVLLSGSGRTLQNVFTHIESHGLAAEVVLAIADRASATGLTHASSRGIAVAIEKDPAHIFELLRAHRVELVCLAGYLRLLAPIPADFRGRVLNIHPALLPRFGGAGYYGERVHRAVLEQGEHESGCTVHLCDDEYDHGRILLQHRVPVLPDDTVASLAARVFEAECEAYPAAIELWREQANASRHAAVNRDSVEN